ncbi:MAG: AMP-binding protein, partial [Bacteroidota bacterium]
MNIPAFFEQARSHIYQQEFSKLKALSLDKPTYFNWVEEIFYDLNVKSFGEARALIWRYYEQEKVYSFQTIYEAANQLLNLLRSHKVKQGDHIYSLLPLVPANWISFLATIKGGFVMMPTATNLTSRDLIYRFESLFP